LSDCGIGVMDTAAAATADDVAPAVNQHRVLIFCQLKSMLDIVERDLLQYVSVQIVKISEHYLHRTFSVNWKLS